MSSSNLLIGFETFAYGIPKVTFLLHLLKHPKASKLGGSVDRSGYLVVTLALNGGASFLILIWKLFYRKRKGGSACFVFFSKSRPAVWLA